MSDLSTIEAVAAEKGIRMTRQRRVVAQVLAESDDHPDAEELFARARKLDSKVSLASVYRTMSLFTESGLVDSHNFGDGRARYELADDDDHHDHLIDVTTGEVVEFFDAEIEELKEKIAKRLGYRLVDHRLELFGKKLQD